jgi:hypothetical protein
MRACPSRRRTWTGQRLLHGVHDLRLDRIDIAGEVVEEIVLGDPAEALRIDIDIRHRRSRRTLLQQRADRLALVEAEAGDVDEANDVRRAGAREVMTWPPYDRAARTVGPLSACRRSMTLSCRSRLPRLRGRASPQPNRAPPALTIPPIEGRRGEMGAGTGSTQRRPEPAIRRTGSRRGGHRRQPPGRAPVDGRRSSVPSDRSRRCGDRPLPRARAG